MYLFKRVADLRAHLQLERSAHRSIGFVPTMGALHAGHLSLIERSLADNQVTVCSIFVNPTQFNDPEDLRKYPRTPGADLALLEAAKCDIVFLPLEEDIYPPDLPTPQVDLAGLDGVLEGAHRPGHFAGVVQVMSRLLAIVQPERLYMGQKDYQQCVIVKRMIRQLSLPVTFVMAPTVREATGLARSSRNTRLTSEQREAAAAIYQTLQEAARLNGHDPAATAEWGKERLRERGFQPEYFSLVDGHSLQSVANTFDAELIMACTAVWVDGVRLIDNLAVKGDPLR